MVGFRVLLARVRGFFTKRGADRELNDEIRAHLEMLEEENRRKGMTPAEAHNAARREFGGIEQMKETYRETNGLRFIETLVQDLRYGLRMLRRNPGFTLVVVLSMALGVGANTAIFSALDAVMLQTLPVREPQQLFMLQWYAKAWPENLVPDLEGSGLKDETTGLFYSYSFTYQAYQKIHDENHVFSHTFAFAANDDEVNAGINGQAEVAKVQAVSGNYFEGLGVPAIVGRTLLPQDDQDSAPAVAVVSNTFWHQRLGADAFAAGKTVVLNGRPFTIIGVAPPEFHGIEPGSSPDFFISLTQYSAEQMRQGNSNNGLPFLRDPKTWWVGVVGRLRPETSKAEAEAELAVLFNQSIRLPDGVADPNTPFVRLSSVSQGLDSLRRPFSKSLWLLMGMVWLVLLIASGNVASLLLTRATARQREIAVRLSMGARRSRIIRQLLTESVLLALLGGVAGLFFAMWANSVLLRLLSSGRSPVHVQFQLNVRVLAFTAVIAILSGVLLGLVPALRATRVDLLAALKQNASEASSRRRVSGKFLVGGQVSLSLLLLVGAGLFLRTLQSLEKLDIGFDRQDLLLFTVRPGLNGYEGTQLAHFYEELQRRIYSIPGVHSVSFSDRGPIGSGAGITTGTIPGYTPPGKQVNIWRHLVGSEYFQTLGIRIILGRAIEEQDGPANHPVVVINQKMVKDHFHNDNPLGRYINFGDAKHPQEFEVVGVVDNVKYAQLRQEVPPTAYFSYLQRSAVSNFMTFEVRSTGGDILALVTAVRHQAQALDKNVPLVNVRTEEEMIEQVLFLERTFATLSTSFGSVALLLACVGLYGTMAYAVARRTNEIGVRMALGAKRGIILGMVLRETLTVVLIGVAVGFPLAWFATVALKSQLYGLTAHDPLTLFLATVTIVAVSAIAGYIPARRASRVDPMVALRYE